MGIVQRKLSKVFKEFFDDQKSSGGVLIFCTIVSLIITNSFLSENYLRLWHFYIAGLSVEHWINDGLMAIFFLLIGLELNREFQTGELSNFKTALLPVIAAFGGAILPALIHFSLNRGSETQAGVGIPMATDIAFALGALALLGNRVSASLKVFLAALAVIDDLIAIVVIAVFYASHLSILYLLAALTVFAVLLALNRLRVMRLAPYLIGGALMWFLMLKSGVHATVAGVLLGFVIPLAIEENDDSAPALRLEHSLQKPVAFLILPVFALANTGVVIGADFLGNLTGANEAGIIAGLLVGKPIGITLASFFAVATGFCRLPLDLNWKHVFGAGILGGIGFTMSIFITNLAFAGEASAINNSKMAVLLASLAAGTIGFVWLKLFGKPEVFDADMDAMDFAEE